MISAIIPCWNEAAVIESTIASAHAIADEVIVVDSRSPDNTGSLALRSGATVIDAPRGRGIQLAAGAAAARGDTLLFLHADAQLPPTARREIEHALSDPSVGGGNFKLRFVPADPWARVFAWLNHERRRWLRIYYGDSGLFVRREVYNALGGFRPLPIMEDHDFVQRLERASRTVYLTEVEIVVSARRFAAQPLRTLAIWTLIQTLASSGVAPHRLARLYADIR